LRALPIWIVLASLDSGWFGVDRWRPLSLYQRDHGPRDGSDLATWMRAQLTASGIEAADGKIWLQASTCVRLCVQSGQFLVLPRSRRSSARAAG